MLRILALFATASVPLCAAVVATPIDYQDGDTALRGTLVLPEAPKAGEHRPGVVVVHEWWGHNAYADRRARELAEAGYAAFALDMYGVGKVTEDPKQAGAWAGPFYGDRALLVRRAQAGIAAFAKQPGVDSQHIAAIGFCFGGTVCLELARSGAPLAGVVSLHGGLKTGKRAEPDTIKAQVLVLHGGADPLVPPSEVADFFDEMTKAKAVWRFEAYGGALHAFTNPKAAEFHKMLPPVDYNPEAERRAFTATYTFLREVLGEQTMR
jgi:dienelactone hydrolase